MSTNKYATLQLYVSLTLILCTGLVTACAASDERPTPAPELRTWLLVRPPDAPLPANQPVVVRSRTQGDQEISHVELYAVELPSGDKNVLLRADRPPFPQTTFTVSQSFTPVQPGTYVIKVMGYNVQGTPAVSDFLGFEVK